MDDNSIDKTYIKVILLGDTAVGKTNIILRYYKDYFDPKSLSTIGSNFIIKKLIRGNTEYNLHIWDTTGQEKYHSVTKLFVQGSKIVLLVYSVENRESFDKLDYWYKTVLEICNDGENVVFAIVGNKNDLFDDEACVITEEEGQNYAKEKKAIFKLVSAKVDKKGIDSLFDEVLDEYIKINKDVKVEESFKLGKIKKEKKKKDNKKKFC